jgi:hypothetical protein
VLVFTLSRAEEENLRTPSKVVVDLWPSSFFQLLAKKEKKQGRGEVS